MTDAIIGYGARFGRRQAINSGSYINVAEVKRIKPPGMRRDTVDATHLRSPNMVKEFVGALIEMSDCTMTINYVPSVSDLLAQWFTERDGRFQITAPNGVRLSFIGVMTAYEPGEYTPDGLIEAEITTKPTGFVTVQGAVGLPAPLPGALPNGWTYEDPVTGEESTAAPAPPAGGNG